MKHAPFSGNRAALAVAAAVSLSLGSCWLPAFDPAVSLSVEMDEFFEEYGDLAWRREYEIAVGNDQDQWLGDLEFMPRRDSSPGGMLVLRSLQQFKVVTIYNGGLEWVIDGYWQYSGELGLGKRSLIESFMPSGMPGLLLLTNASEGPWYLQAYGSPEPLSMSPGYYAAFASADRLLGFGVLGTNPSNNPLLHLLSFNPGTGTTTAYTAEITAGAVIFAPTPGGAFLPGAIQPGYAISDAGLPILAEFDRGGPELWTWSPASAAAAHKADIEASVTGAFRAPALTHGIGLLAEGPLYTDIYDGSSDRLGSLPTGAWRYAFQWWDDLNSQWLMVFSRILRIQDGKDNMRLIVRVEAVPTQALLAFAD